MGATIQRRIIVSRRKLLYVFIAVLGIVFLTVFLPNPLFFPTMNLFSYFSPIIGSVTWALLVSCFFSIVGTVFFIAGLCGIKSQYFRKDQSLSVLQPNLVGDSKKHFKLYGFIALLGFVFLGLFLAIAYWSEHSGEVTRFFMSIPLSGSLMFIVFLFGGTIFLTIGVCGVARGYFKRNKNLFTVLAAISVPSLILVPFVYLWISALEVGL